MLNRVRCIGSARGTAAGCFNTLLGHAVSRLLAFVTVDSDDTDVRISAVIGNDWPEPADVMNIKKGAT
jgi:hypothetical protein